MMLIVIAYIQCNDIQSPVVAVGFLGSIDQIMFLDPAGTKRMQANGEEEREEKVEKRCWPEQKYDGSIVSEDGNPVEEGPGIGELDFLQTRRAKGLKEWEKEEPERFPQER